MNKRLVYIPISYRDGYNMSANLKCDNKTGAEVYLKNAFVALNSVKKFNDNVDLAIVVNFNLSSYFEKLFKESNITVYIIEFEDFKMPADFVWSLAFFKITALKYISQNTSYEYTLQMESDEICINNIEDMWGELDCKILTIFAPFRIGHPGRVKYSKLLHEIYKTDNKLVVSKTGAGFIAGKKDKLLDFVRVCDEIYDFIKDKKFRVEKNLGDELYPSIYCALYPDRVADANAYATVYWTGSFYLVSTNYRYDPVSIIHLPAEKKRGLLKIFNYYIKNNKLPSNEKIYKIMHFPKRPIRFVIRDSLARLKKRILH